MAKTRTINRTESDRYFSLVKRFPLRVIRTRAEHAAAIGIINELIDQGDDTRDDGETDYLEALARFVADYEQAVTLKLVSQAGPADVLRHLMNARGMRITELGKLIGKTAATMVLNGSRELSKSHIRTLAAHFGVSPALFI